MDRRSGRGAGVAWMQVVDERCSGLDVHKKSVTACCITPEGKETRTFGTMTEDLLAMADWLRSMGCTHVAMESTGVFWKPVYNLLEDYEFGLLVVNARHIKAVPGRKTDVKDAEWIAALLRHGLLRGSHIPSRPERELRELVRYRKSLIRELERALAGRVSAHLRFMLAVQLTHIDGLDEGIDKVSREIEERMRPFEEGLANLRTIPGVGQKITELILAEVGPDMSRFSSHKHLAAWAGLCPGNNESAGKRYSGRTRKGSPWLREGLVEAARAAAHTKNTYLSAQYHRIAARRGAKRAAVAVAHTMLVIAYHILSRGTTYQELGGDYFDRRNRDKLVNQLAKRLERLGYKVVSQEQAA